MNELSNCPECGDIFLKTPFKDVYQKCWKEEEKNYEIVYNYLRKRENRTATLKQVVEDTEIEEGLILKFIRNGRLKLANFPNLGYPCDNCGVLIRTGRMCQPCADKITEELRKFDREEARRKELEDKERRKTYLAIKEINKKKNF